MEIKTTEEIENDNERARGREFKKQWVSKDDVLKFLIDNRYNWHFGKNTDILKKQIMELKKRVR